MEMQKTNLEPARRESNRHHDNSENHIQKLARNKQRSGARV